MAGSSSSSSGIPRRQWRVEPSCVVTLQDHHVTSLTLANSDRICAPDPCSAGETDQFKLGSSSSTASAIERTVAPRADGMTGALKFYEGYNCSILLNTANNSIRFGGNIGAGDGEVCDEIARTAAEEEQQANNEILDNALRCSECIYTINGISPDENGHFRIEAGRGLDIQKIADCLTFTVQHDIEECHVS